MRWMSGLEGSGKELCEEQGEGVVYGENLGFCVKVPSGGYVVFRQAVVMRRAVFWRVCIFFILVWAMLGNQMRAA